MNPTLAWLRAAAIRAIKTAAQATLAVLGTGVTGLLDVNWANTLSVAALAMLMSLLTSIAGLPEVDGGASLPIVIDDTECERTIRQTADRVDPDHGELDG